MSAYEKNTVMPEKHDSTDKLSSVQATFIRKFYQICFCKGNINNSFNVSARLSVSVQCFTQEVDPEKAGEKNFRSSCPYPREECWYTYQNCFPSTPLTATLIEQVKCKTSSKFPLYLLSLMLFIKKL